MVQHNQNHTELLITADDLNCRLEGNTLSVSGRLTVENSGDLALNVIKKTRSLNIPELKINLEKLDDIDSAGVMTLLYIKGKLLNKIKEISIEGANTRVNKKIELFSSETSIEAEPTEERFVTEIVGKSTQEFIFSYLYGFLLLAANLFYWSLADLFRAKTTRKGEFVNQSVIIGANAAAIVIVMSFAIGFVMAVQSAEYLREFGADIYIVDLIVIAIMSQMGPLITAVLVAGRSGSAIAAEIATMKVTAELDALRTMGLDPVRYVVVPKLYASLFTIPLLIILANVAGIAGGATAAYNNLDISPEVFLNRMENLMTTKHLITAFIKSQVYACIIVLTGSFYGFRVDRGAEGVGKVTTMAVVVSLSLVILADSFMAVLFY